MGGISFWDEGVLFGKVGKFFGDEFIKEGTLMTSILLISSLTLDSFFHLEVIFLSDDVWRLLFFVELGVAVIYIVSFGSFLFSFLPTPSYGTQSPLILFVKCFSILTHL